jgi:adenylate kinase
MATILVFGVSGVGKSWHCRQAAEALNLRHVSGSDLIRQEKNRLTSISVSADSLRQDRVVDNQQMLLDGFRAFRTQDERSILFDGHNVVDTDDQLIEIPFEVIAQLNPAAIAIVAGSPADIIRRRANDPMRDRPVRSIERITAYQDLCIDLARKQAERLSVPMALLNSGTTAEFIAFAQEHM